jgi:hypothetical protein
VLRLFFQLGVAPHRTALLQLATKNKVYLFHIWYCGMSPALVEILTRPDIGKVGNNIAGDIAKINTDFQVPLGLPSSCLYTSLPPSSSVPAFLPSGHRQDPHGYPGARAWVGGPRGRGQLPPAS